VDPRGDRIKNLPAKAPMSQIARTSDGKLPSARCFASRKNKVSSALANHRRIVRTGDIALQFERLRIFSRSRTTAFQCDC
jgi:hypothetical protein